jgi:hypothetical protein
MFYILVESYILLYLPYSPSPKNTAISLCSICNSLSENYWGEIWNIDIYLFLFQAAVTELPQPVSTMPHPPTMTAYGDMERFELRMKSIARGFEDPIPKDELIAFLLQDDKKRQEEDAANARLFDYFDDSNDPTYEERINVRQKQFDLQKLRLQTEGDNLVRTHSLLLKHASEPGKTFLEPLL